MPAPSGDVTFTDRVHMMPVIDGATASAPPVGAHLDYHGGKVIQRVRIIQVLYGLGTYLPELTSTGGASMSAAYAQMTTSGALDWLSEYDTTTPAQVIGRGSFGGSFPIVPAASRGGTRITDASVQSELAAQIAAGELPGPSDDHLYMLSSPAGASIIAPDGTTSCVAGGFCAYHGTFKIGSRNVYYAVLPALTGACATGCGSGSDFERQQLVASHELIAAVTDPEIGLTTAIGPPNAWYDSDRGEAAEVCNGQQATFAGLDGRAYAIQKGFSNRQDTCIVLRAPQPSAREQYTIYRGTDGRVHRMFNDGAGWEREDDLTSVLGGAEPASDPVGYSTGGTQHAVFRTLDGHVLDLLTSGTQRVGVQDLTALLGGDGAAGAPSVHVRPTTQHILFRSAAGDLRELFHDGTRWVANNNLTALLGGDGPAGDPSGYILDDAQHLVYRSANNHVHELFNDGTRWVGNTDLTTQLGGHGAAGDPSGYVLGRTQHVVYRCTDNHLHELVNDGTRWVVNNNLTEIIGGHEPIGEPSGYARTSTQHIVYRCADNHVHELFHNGAIWTNNNLSDFLGGVGTLSDPVGYRVGVTQHILFHGTDGHLHEYYNDGTRWADHDLTRFVGGSAPAGAITAWVR